MESKAQSNRERPGKFQQSELNRQRLGGNESFANQRWKRLNQGYEKFGFNVRSNGDIVYREWAPNAAEAYLVGDFST